MTTSSSTALNATATAVVLTGAACAADPAVHTTATPAPSTAATHSPGGLPRLLDELTDSTVVCAWGAPIGETCGRAVSVEGAAGIVDAAGVPVSVFTHAGFVM